MPIINYSTAASGTVLLNNSTILSGNVVQVPWNPGKVAYLLMIMNYGEIPSLRESEQYPAQRRVKNVYVEGHTDTNVIQRIKVISEKQRFAFSQESMLIQSASYKDWSGNPALPQAPKVRIFAPNGTTLLLVELNVTMSV